MKVKAVIFDMDGVIIDSEPFWQQAQITALAAHNVQATVEQCESLTKGKRLDEIARVWCQHFNLPSQPRQLEQAILHHVTTSITANGKALPGVEATLRALQQRNCRIALATSSSHRVIDAVFDKLQLRHYFEIVSSADNEPRGKPDPAVYLSTARKLALPATDCLVVEDSLNGFRAAQSAGMAVFMVSPDCHNPNFLEADGRYLSLPEMLAALPEPAAQPV
ncbi:HAD-IA family hydrolase [Mangrovibacter sp. SLW1]